MNRLFKLLSSAYEVTHHKILRSAVLVARIIHTLYNMDLMKIIN